MKLKVVFFLLSILSVKSIYSQIKELDSLLEKKRYTTFNDRLQKVNLNQNQYHYYQGKLYLQKRKIDKAIEVLKKIDTTQLTNPFDAWFYYVLGDSYRYQNREEKGFHLKVKAQKLFKKYENPVMSNKINHDLHYTLASQDFLDYDGESYLKIFFENAKKINLPEQLLTAHLSFSIFNLSSGNIERGLFHLDEANKYARIIGTPEAFYKVQNYKAVFFQNINDNKKARVHTDSLLFYAKLLKSPDRIDTSLKNSALNYTLNGDYAKAIDELRKADTLKITENIYNRKRYVNQYLSLNYENTGNIDSAFHYLKEMIKYSDSIHVDKQNAILIELETEELSKKNLILKEEKVRQRNYLYLSIAGLIVILAVSIAVSSFYRKKKVLMTRARSLLDEAYEKMRNIAHIEDAASKPSYWLDAIRDFAANVSETKKLNIEIDTFGLEDFVDVTLENDLRRIVIELITNILKYANASEVSIEIVKRNNLLNIIVEDNGKGFDTADLEKTNGIGLKSIHRKIEELKGEFTIDYQRNRGTTIIIEIPV